MAARTVFRGRKRPRRKQNRYLVHGRWINVRYFDGYRLRHGQPDDVDILIWRGDGSKFSKVADPDTLMIDKPHRAETEFLVKVYEIMTMRKWTRRGDNRRLPPYQKLREYLKQALCADREVAEGVYVDRKEWNAEHQVNIWYVRGDVIRKVFDPHFMHGGHDLVYPAYIKEPRTIWIDIHQDERETPYTIVHEIAERKKMARGWSYGKAHAHAIQVELALRLKEYLIGPERETVDPLLVTPIEQSDTGCGTTSAKMMLDYDGVFKPDGTPYTEDDLIVLCNCDPQFGTDHAPLVAGLRKIVGDRVVHGDGGTIDDLRRLVLLDRRPVMVGWWDGQHRTSDEVRADLANLDAGHYSVVVHVTRTHVWLADPWIVDTEDDSNSAPGIRKMRIKDFLEYWYDMDGYPTETDPGSHLVRGWYLYLRKA